MDTLKDKAKKKRDKRQERKVIQIPVETIKPELKTPANIETQRVAERKAIETTPATVAGVNAPDLSKPAAMAVRGYQDRGAVEKANPTPIATPTQVAAQNPSGGITNANIEAAKTAIAEANKPLTLSDLLEKQRKKAEVEKTDAAKMQKYYALTDALSALGKIGGSVVGGAVGGNVMDSAPAVPEYKESRGYLEAFEKAKQANDRLRALDDAEYNLALKDEERSYKQQEAKLEREYRKQLLDYENQLKQAQAQRNYDLELALKTKIENLTHEHRMAQEKLKGDYETEQSKIYQDTVKIQSGAKNTGSGRKTGGTSSEKVIPIFFKDKSVQYIPDSTLAAIKAYLINNSIGEGKKAISIDASNVDSIIRDNPELINELLINSGVIEAPNAEDATEHEVVETTSAPANTKAPQAETKKTTRTTTPKVDVVESKNSLRKSDYYMGEIDPLLAEEITPKKASVPAFNIVSDGRGGVRIIQAATQQDNADDWETAYERK